MRKWILFAIKKLKIDNYVRLLDFKRKMALRIIYGQFLCRIYYIYEYIIKQELEKR